MVMISARSIPLYKRPVHACGVEDEVDGPQGMHRFLFSKRLNIFGVEIMYANRKYPAS
jgi:hypothetical protein